MRIAQIAPLTEAIPPKLYGGTERVVSWLTEELLELGHDVTLFASGNSVTAARLEPMWPRALRLDNSVRDPMALHISMLERVRRQASEFDILHFHLDSSRSRCSRASPRLSSPPCTAGSTCRNIRRCSTRSGRCPSCRFQRPARARAAGALAAHRLSRPACRPAAATRGEVRLPRLPRPHRAGEGGRPGDRIAKRCNLPLKIAAKVDRADATISSRRSVRCSACRLDYIGEIGDEDKSEFLGGAMRCSCRSTGPSLSAW